MNNFLLKIKYSLLFSLLAKFVFSTKQLTMKPKIKKNIIKKSQKKINNISAKNKEKDYIEKKKNYNNQSENNKTTR